MMKINWISLLALLVSIIALMLSCRVAYIDFKDYWGFVLGVLSLFVTLLIGWQIYNSLDIKKQLDETRKKQIEIEKQFEDYKKSFTVVECGLNYIQGLSNVNERPLSAYRDFIRTLDSAYDSNNHNVIEDCFNNLKAVIQKVDKEKKVNENIAEKEIQIQEVVDLLKKNIRYSEFSWRIDLIEENRIKILEEIRNNSSINN